LVQKEIEKTVASIHRDMCPNVPGEKKYIALPVKGLGQEQVMKKLTEYQQMGVHYDWKSGKISGTVYHGGEALNDLLTDAFRKFIVSNPLHPETFPGLRKMEAEIVSMVVNMYNGDKNACGSITSGGSESIIMALKTHREWAKEKKGITDPEIVIPVSAHAAFDKGAQYFGITIIHVPVDDDGRVNIKKVANSINRNTIMLAGSTPNFPHGSIDDIPALGKLALKHNIGLHVDSCLVI
jgi:sphinganine-1-phosphate aldolase